MSCCSPAAQDACCGPEDKAACCGTSAAGGSCGCPEGGPEPVNRARPACALDDAALAEQLARWRRIGAHAVRAHRDTAGLTVVLDRGLDEALLRETLAIERSCCPFLALIYEPGPRELTVAAPAEHAALLERVARALAVTA
jgi:hypothetical protein